MNYAGQIPPQIQIMDVPEADYIVFEHGPFDYEQENRSVENKIEMAMSTFDYSQTDYCLDFTPKRLIYFHFNPQRYWKYIRPVQRKKQGEKPDQVLLTL